MEARLIVGDAPGAWSIVEDALTGGATPQEIYTSIIGPAMESIGDRWANDELTVAHEHQATGVVYRILGRLGPTFHPRGARRGTVVVAAAAGDLHGLPTAILADMCRLEGINVIDLGPNTPGTAVADVAEGIDDLLAVAVCASISGNDVAIQGMLGDIRDAIPAVPVLLGGHAINSLEMALELGATGYCPNGEDAVRVLSEIASGATSTPHGDAKVKASQ